MSCFASLTNSVDCHESATFYKVAYSRNGSVRAIDSMQCTDSCNDINCHKVVLTFRNDNKSPPPTLRVVTPDFPLSCGGGIKGVGRFVIAKNTKQFKAKHYFFVIARQWRSHNEAIHESTHIF